MPFCLDERRALLRERAAEYVGVALSGITREYPVMPIFIAAGPGPYPTYREQHPAFYGCFDWHSCVLMHWVLVRLLRLFPDEVDQQAVRETLNALLTSDNLAQERHFFEQPLHGIIERPYGWGWLLTLQFELETWDHPDGRRWAAAVRPLAERLMEKLVSWLPAMTYPVRSGVHPNTAFALSRSYDYAHLKSEEGDAGLLQAIRDSAYRWFRDDRSYPAHYEPSGSDFLSAALCEAELMSLLMGREELSEWLTVFLPTIEGEEPASLFTPAEVSDSVDGHIAHLHGLNLSRAWAFTCIAERLPAEDPRVTPLLAGAERHAAASLPLVAGSDYMVEHWLAAYAVLLLS